jgi:benzoate-CoA ligase
MSLMTQFDLPDRLNAADVFVDSHLEAGRSDKVAILSGDRSITYRALHENVNRFAHALGELGVRHEERVVILLPDMPEWVYAFFGAMKRGAVAVPLNTNLKASDYEYFLNDSRARVLVVEPRLLDRIEEIRGNLKFLEDVLVVGGEAPGCLPFDDVMSAASSEFSPFDTSKDDMAFWLYSSGTTGLPKGAIHLHHDMIVEADLYAQRTIGVQETDVCFSVAKLFFAYGLGNGLYFPLRVGATTVLLPDRPSPDKVFEVVDKFEPTLFYSVPTSYVQLLDAAERSDRNKLGRVRLCISAGEPLPKHIFDKWQQRFGLEILDGIGSTEILHIYISNRPGEARAGSTGRLVEGYEAKIIDDDGRELPPRSVGTLLIKGDSIAAGYWNKHEETKNTFFGHWINTRDKFLVDEDGYFWYAGRADDMFKVSGQAVWPADVEGVLMQHPAVLESGVVGGADPNGLVKPIAFVVLKDGHQASPELSQELQQFVKNAGSPHKYPRAVVFMAGLPKTATGKIKRFKLRELVGQLTPLHTPPAEANG